MNKLGLVLLLSLHAAPFVSASALEAASSPTNADIMKEIKELQQKIVDLIHQNTATPIMPDPTTEPTKTKKSPYKPVGNQRSLSAKLSAVSFSSDADALAAKAKNTEGDHYVVIKKDDASFKLCHFPTSATALNCYSEKLSLMQKGDETSTYFGLTESGKLSVFNDQFIRQEGNLSDLTILKPEASSGTGGTPTGGTGGTPN